MAAAFAGPGHLGLQLVETAVQRYWMSNTDDPSKVLVGEDSWLFLQNDSNCILDQIQGIYPTPDEFTAEWRRLFEYRRWRFSTFGIPYLCCIAPNKECVYHRHLPQGIAFSRDRPVYKIMAQANAVVDVVYPLDVFQSQPDLPELYVRGDTHWNAHGAVLFYRLVMDAIGVEAMPGDRLRIVGKMEKGDLSWKLGHLTYYERPRIIHPDFDCTFNNAVANVGHRIDYVHRRKDLPSCLLFRDSFSTIQLPLYAQSFSRLWAVWQPNIDYGLVQELQPDFVISQQVERMLVHCPDDIAGKTNAEYAAAKRAGVHR